MSDPSGPSQSEFRSCLGIFLSRCLSLSFPIGFSRLVRVVFPIPASTTRARFRQAVVNRHLNPLVGDHEVCLRTLVALGQRALAFLSTRLLITSGLPPETVSDADMGNGCFGCH